MSYKYSDQNDLIQNQRALAELVGQINDQFTRIRDDGFADKFDAELKKLQADLNKLVTDCTNITNTHATEMSTTITNIENRISTLSSRLNDIMATLLNLDNNSVVSLNELVGRFSSLETLLYGEHDENGHFKPETGMRYRFDEVEKRVPSIVIHPEEDHVFTSEEQALMVDGVLYGRITDQVRDIEVGAAVKISPYLQGVIRETGKEG